MSPNYRYQFTSSSNRRAMLQAHGIPLDEPPPYTLPGSAELHVSQVGGLMENSIFGIGGMTGYLIALAISTNIKAGITICEWDLRSPATTAPVVWLTDPHESIPAQQSYKFPSPGPEFDRETVINHRKRVKPGECIEGLLVGKASAAIPKQFKHGLEIEATLVAVDQLDRRLPFNVLLWVNRAYSEPRKEITERKESLLDSTDFEVHVRQKS